MKACTTLTIILAVFSSCSSPAELEMETKNFSFQMRPASGFMIKSTNSYGYSPLEIEAESMSFQEILSLLLEKEKEDFQVLAPQFKEQSFACNYQQKNAKSTNNAAIVQNLLDTYNLEIVEKETYLISAIYDSTKYTSRQERDSIPGNASKVIIKPNKIELSNVPLEKLLKVLYKEYEVRIMSTEGMKDDRLSLSWKKSEANDPVRFLEEKLGLEISLNKAAIVYQVKERS